MQWPEPAGSILVIAIPIDTFAVLSELMSTWNRPDAMDFAAVIVDLVPHYRALLES